MLQHLLVNRLCVLPPLAHTYCVLEEALAHRDAGPISAIDWEHHLHLPLGILHEVSIRYISLVALPKVVISCWAWRDTWHATIFSSHGNRAIHAI
jgi:hypothetical protein